MAEDLTAPPDDYAMMRVGLAAALRTEAKRKTIPPLWPGGPGGYGATFEDLADAALGVFRSVMELMREQRDTAERGQDLLSARLERLRDLIDTADAAAAAGFSRMYTGEPFPASVGTAEVRALLSGDAGRDRLHDAVQLLLINHHHELLKPAGEQDPEIAELAAVYQQLTGWDALEEIRQDVADGRAWPQESPR